MPNTDFIHRSKTLELAQLQYLIVDALEDVKAQDIEVFDVMPITTLFDRVVIASGTSNRQTRALAKSVHDKVKENGGEIYGMEGEDTGEWVLVDCGDVVVHIQQPAIREYYRLSDIWGEKPIALSEVTDPVRKKKAPARKPTAKKPVMPSAAEKKADKKAAEKKVAEKVVAEKAPAKKAAAKKPASKGATKSAAKAPAKKPASKKPAAKKPAAKKPAAKRPAITREASATKPPAKKPAARKPAAKKPAAKRPSTKVAAKAPAKAADKKPAAKKPTPRG